MFANVVGIGRGPISEWQEKATTDAAQIKAWFTTNFPAAIPGIQLDKSNLFVVDLDQHPGGPRLVARGGADERPAVGVSDLGQKDVR